MQCNNTIILIGAVLLMMTVSFSCTQQPGQADMKIDQQPFGTAPDGTPVDLYTLTNIHGLKAAITNYGGIVVSLFVPDRNGELDDIVLGYETLDGYIANSPYFGALIGRYGNRIARGKFTLDGQEYTLATNDGDNHLHGGTQGFDKVVWDAEQVVQDDAVGLKLTYLSRDGEEGYPGNLSCTGRPDSPAAEEVSMLL